MRDRTAIAITALMLVAMFALPALASTTVRTPSSEDPCPEQSYNIRLANGSYSHIGRFETAYPEGRVLMITGPERSYTQSKELIKTFCHHGFSVIAFDVRAGNSSGGIRPSNADIYVTVGKIAENLKKIKPAAPLVVYGWSKGSRIAANVARTLNASKLILENPAVDAAFAMKLARFPRGYAEVFECRESRASIVNLRKFSRKATLLVPAHEADCSHHQLSALAEARDPMGEFIESDFAGIRANIWYWRRL